MATHKKVKGQLNIVVTLIVTILRYYGPRDVHVYREWRTLSVLRIL